VSITVATHNKHIFVMPNMNFPFRIFKFKREKMSPITKKRVIYFISNNYFARNKATNFALKETFENNQLLNFSNRLDLVRQLRKIKDLAAAFQTSAAVLVLMENFMQERL